MSRAAATPLEDDQRVDLADNRRHRRHDLDPRPLAWRVVLLRRALAAEVTLLKHCSTEQEALEYVERINKRIGWWAVVDTLYECGCWSYARFEGDPR